MGVSLHIFFSCLVSFILLYISDASCKCNVTCGAVVSASVCIHIYIYIRAAEWLDDGALLIRAFRCVGFILETMSFASSCYLRSFVFGNCAVFPCAKNNSSLWWRRSENEYRKIIINFSIARNSNKNGCGGGRETEEGGSIWKRDNFCSTSVDTFIFISFYLFL